MKGFFARIGCLLFGHVYDGTGYFLEYVAPTAKSKYGYSHDLQECRRCGESNRIHSELYYWPEYKEWKARYG